MIESSLLPVVNAFLEDKGLQNIADAAARVMGNPFWIVDMNSNYMTHISGRTSNKRLLAESRQGYPSDEILLYTARENIRERANDADKGVLFSAMDDDLRIMTSAVKITGVTVAFISVIEESKSFEEEDGKKLNDIAQIISAQLQKYPFYQSNKEMIYSYFLADLLTSSRNYPDIDRRMEIMGLSLKKYIYLMTVELSNIENRKVITNSLQNQLQNICPNSIYCLYQEHFIFLFSAKKDLDKEDHLFKRLRGFMKESGLKAAVSDSFNDITQTALHYRKTLEALRIGQLTLPKESLYRYFALITDHVLDILDGSVSYSDFCDKAVDKLSAYDDRNHTKLLHTLYCFLECNENYAASAQKLALHPNTMRQRLDKIREITGCNFDNGHQVFEMMLALKLYLHRLSQR